jgi:pimeloyl-ACP methyl ester carboxylesterase
MVMARSASRPITFNKTLGLFEPAASEKAARNIGVLFVSPWGLEEMATRKFYREIAENLADFGIASLRFDFPGTGDSLDPSSDEPSLESWVETTVIAAAQLRKYSGCTHILLLGQGLGGTLASMAAARLDNVTGLALLAPVTNGRMFLREISLWWKMIATDLGLESSPQDSGQTSIAGMTLPQNVANAIKKLKTSDIPLPEVKRALVVQRQGRDTDREISDLLQQRGSQICRLDFAGYDNFVTNTMVSELPQTVMESVISWVLETAATVEEKAGFAEPLPQAVQHDSIFTETATTFGDNGRMFGILCEPVAQRQGATVLILGTSYDRHAGWGRQGVRLARKLAASGIASLRFDAANVADSPPVDGAPLQVLYSDWQMEDVRQALDYLEARQMLPAVLTGRCSGGYLAYQAALNDDRCSAIALFNPFAFVWDTNLDVDDALQSVARPLTEYGKRAFKLETIKRILAGKVDIKAAIWNLTMRVTAHIGVIVAPLLGSLSSHNRLKSSIIQSFNTTSARKLPMTLVYGAGDTGLEQIKLCFGAAGDGLKKFPNIDFHIVPGMDHNVTTPDMQALMQSYVTEAAMNFQPTEKQPTARQIEDPPEGVMLRRASAAN